MHGESGVGGSRALSSARAHLQGRDDALVVVRPLLDRRGGRFADPVDAPPPVEAISTLPAAETIGRPLSSGAFLDHVAALAGRDPRPRKRGPKRKNRG